MPASRRLRQEHPSTLSTVHNIAYVFDNQGEYGKAMEWYERVLAGKEKFVGKYHPSTLGTVNNIAMVFNERGKYGEAMG